VRYSIPPPEPRHSIAELLTLVGAIRRVAYDVTLEAGDALRRIRDAIREYKRRRLTRTPRRPAPDRGCGPFAARTWCPASPSGPATRPGRGDTGPFLLWTGAVGGGTLRQG